MLRSVTTNELLSPSAPATLIPTSTVTRSPCSNGSCGVNAAPLPSGCSRQLPVWAPLREPVTSTSPTSSPPTPRSVTPVSGEAVERGRAREDADLAVGAAEARDDGRDHRDRDEAGHGGDREQDGAAGA